MLCVWSWRLRVAACAPVYLVYALCVHASQHMHHVHLRIICMHPQNGDLDDYPDHICVMSPDIDAALQLK